MQCFLFLRWITFCSDCRRQVFFYLVDKKSDRVRQVVVLYSKDYMELVWVVSELVVLNEWSSYRGGRFSRFDCRTAQQDIFLKDMMFTIAFCRQIKSKFHIPKVSEFVFFFSIWVFIHKHSRITGLQEKREGVNALKLIMRYL